jgi:hypothetical protein
MSRSFMSVPLFTLVSTLLVAVPACDPAAPDALSVSESSTAYGRAPRTVDQGVLTVAKPERRTLVKGQTHRFRLQAAAGRTVSLVASSDVLLPSLRVIGPGASGKTVEGKLDPETVDLRAKTSFRVPGSAGRTASYQIYVTGDFDGDDRGTYQLRASVDGSNGGGQHPVAADCATRHGGAFVTIEVASQFHFTTWVPASNQAFIDHAKENLAAGTHQNVSFPKMVDGTDCDAQWSWNVDATNAEFADFSVEVCDGTPAYIEANKADWFRAPGYYCPWGVTVTAVDVRP